MNPENTNWVKGWSLEQPYLTGIRAGGHEYFLDEPVEDGGADKGATPTQMLLGALCACTVITLRMYASRKNWPLEGVEVEADFSEKGQKEGGYETIIERKVTFKGELSRIQKERLLQIAMQCPVAKILKGQVFIEDITVI